MGIERASNGMVKAAEDIVDLGELALVIVEVDKGFERDKFRNF